MELIDVATGKVLMSIANPDGEFGKLAIAADGSKVAALTGKTIVTPLREWPAGSRIDTRKDLWFASVEKKEKRLLAKELAGVHNLAFIGGDRLAANDSESKIAVWRLDTWPVSKNTTCTRTFFRRPRRGWPSSPRITPSD